MKTKMWAMFLTLTLVLSMFGGLSVSAAEVGNGFVWLGDEEPKPITVLLDGKPLTFDVPPRLMNGRTMVPLRVIFEALGATVYWEDETQTVTAVKGDTIVEMGIGKNELNCSGDRIMLDFPAQLVGGRTLVPTRAVAESFGMIVDWDNDTRTVTIDTPTEPIQPEPAQDVFETAHRKLKDFIIQDGKWDPEDLEYWTGYNANNEVRYDFDMMYSAKGAELVVRVQSDSDDMVLLLRFNEYEYPAAVMMYECGDAVFQIVGYFNDANAPMIEKNNTFLPEDREESRVALKGCFLTMDTFMQNIMGMSLADCGVTY